MSESASIARSVISESESASTPAPSAPESSNAADFPEIAVQEMDHLMADDPTNPTRRIAAALEVFHNPKKFTSTKQGMVRRQFDDDGNSTRRIAREMIDLAAYADGMKADPRDKAAMVAADFARSVNGSTLEGTLPEDGDADAVIDQIIQLGRNAK